MKKNIRIYTLKRETTLKQLEKPYFKGSFGGFIIGLGVSKLINDIYYDNIYGIYTSLIIFFIGIFIWYKQYEKNKLE